MSCSELQTLSSIVSHCLFHIADTLINCVSCLVSYCRHSHQLCLIACSILQTLSLIVSHFLFHIAYTLINCVSFLVPDCRHSHQLCLIACSILQTLSSTVSFFVPDCRHSHRLCVIFCSILRTISSPMSYFLFQTLSSIDSHFLFRIADTLIDCFPYKLQTRSSVSYRSCYKIADTSLPQVSPLYVLIKCILGFLQCFGSLWWLHHTDLFQATLSECSLCLHCRDPQITYTHSSWTRGAVQVNCSCTWGGGGWGRAVQVNYSCT